MAKNNSMLLKSLLIFKTEEQLPEAERILDLRIAEFLVQLGLDIMIKEYKKANLVAEISSPNIGSLVKIQNHMP